MVYIMSDIHGDFDRYRKMFKKINLTENDSLVILGDVVDRGDNGVAILLDVMKRNNVTLLMGNHEQMMLDTVDALPEDFEELTVDRLKKLPADTQDMIASWCGENGGLQTLRDYLALSDEVRDELSDYLAFLPLYQEITVIGVDYVLVHAGLGRNFSPDVV